MAELNFYETGKAAPSRLIRNYSAIYIHQTAKGPITYSQQKFPRGSQWTEIDSAALPVIRVLNDLQNVDTTPNNGDVLAYNSFTQLWVNQPLPASGETFVGQSLFVSQAGDSVANGAVRESLTNHFSLIMEAANAALAGDTIYVYGDHVSTGNLARLDVKWVFLGKGTITGTQTMWDDAAGAIPEIYVRGDAYFNCASAGQRVLNIANADSHYDIECYKILGRGDRVIVINGGRPSSKLKVETTIISNLVNWCVELYSTAQGTIEVGEYIDNIATISGIRASLTVNGLIYDYKIIGDIRMNNISGQSTIYGLSTGGGVLTIEGNIYANPLVDHVFFWGEGAVMCNFDLKLIGDAYTDTRAMWYRYGSSCNIEHIGDVYSGYGGSYVRFEGPATLVHKGNVYSTAAAGPLVTRQTGGVLRMDGKVHNQFVPGALGSVASAIITSGGTGYTGQFVQSNVTTTGGSGVGLVLYITKTGSGAGAFNRIEIQNPGTGYLVGDVVTVSGAGNGDGTVTIESIGEQGVVLKDSAAYDAIFDDVLIVIDETVGATGGLTAFPTPMDVIVTNQVASNQPAVNITNLVTGSTIFDDPQIQ